jgi:hypothetical protein
MTMGKTDAFGEKPVPVPFPPPQITRVLTSDRTRSSAVGYRLNIGTHLQSPLLAHSKQSKSVITRQLQYV